MSDSECEDVTQEAMECGSDAEDVTQLGEAQLWDDATGTLKPTASSGITGAQSAAYISSMPAAAAASASVETWQLTLAEKNASNTHDKKAPHMLGIDEAGRGPVLGSMVYGICWCPLDKLEALKEIKVADSKTLTFAQRQGLFRRIQETPWLGYEVDVISADRLSREMGRRMKVNLNAISHDSAIMLIHAVISHGINVREVYVDTVGDAGKYQEKLCQLFPGISITVSKKADSLFPIVSAASIAAKVTRDLNLEQWKFEEERAQPNGVLLSPSDYPLRCSRQLGSGYPGDPMTKIWLQNHLDGVFGYPALVRFCWGTTKKILKTDAVQCEWGDEEEDDEGEDGEDGGGKGSQKMGKFFSAKDADASTPTKVVSDSAAAAASSAAAALVQSNPNNKKFSNCHDSLTRKQYAIPTRERIGWFQQHMMEIATTF